MSFLEDKCSLFPLVKPEEIVGFSCGDSDLDEFFTRDCFAYVKELLGKTYCYKLDEDSQKVVCAFTLANAGVRVSDLPNARKKKVEIQDSPYKGSERLSGGVVGSFRRC